MTEVSRRAILGGIGAAGVFGFATGRLTAASTPPVSLSKFGAKAGFAGDPVGAFDNATALDNALASGEVIALDGFFFCSRSIAIRNRNTTLRGASSSGIVFPGGHGLIISQDQYTHQTKIDGLEIVTLGRENGTGLSISYSAGDSIGNRTLPRCFLSRTVLRGWDRAQHGWRDGLTLRDVHSAVVRDVWAIGRRDLSTRGRQSFGTMRAGISLTSSLGMQSDPSDTALENVYVYNAQTGIACDGEFEGTSVSGCKLVGVWSGFTLNNRSDRPGLQIHDNHINCFDTGIDIAHTPQAQIHDNLIYKFEETRAATVGVRLRRCDLSHVGENTFINSCSDHGVSGDWYAVEIIDSGNCKVDAQIAERVNRIVTLSGDTTATDVDRQTVRGTYANAAPTEPVVDNSRGGNRLANHPEKQSSSVQGSAK